MSLRVVSQQIQAYFAFAYSPLLCMCHTHLFVAAICQDTRKCKDVHMVNSCNHDVIWWKS